MLNLRRPVFWTYLLIIIIFILDVFFTRDGNISTLYMLTLILGVYFREKNDVFLLGLVTTVLTVVAVFIRPHTDAFDGLLFDRVTGVVGIWGAVYLIIRIHEMRAEEKSQDEQFQALFKYASNGIIIINAKGEIERTNPAAEKLFGYGMGEMVGHKIEALVPTRMRRIHEQHRKDYREHPAPRSMGSNMNLSGLRKDGTEFPVEVSLSPFKTMAGDFVMAFVVDNTIRTEHEQRIIRQNQRLEQLAAALQNLNESLEERILERTKALEQARNELTIALGKERDLGELKSRFVSMASHEFRTPLSTMLSSASLIATYADRNDIENIRRHALRIKNSVNGLNTILTEFLSLGKLEEGKTQVNLQTLDLQECIGEVVAELRPMLKSGQEVELEHNGPSETWLDPGLLKHLLLNIISNAIKYSPENKSIRIESRITDHQVSIRVIDQGMGIPEADQKHLFSRFFRASNASNIQGTGLGLYIVRRYVELMNGTIGFESTEGKGTTVWTNFNSTHPPVS